MRKSGIYFNSSYEEQILQLIKLGLLVYDRKKMLKDLSNKKMLPYLWYFKHEDKDGRCFSSVRWDDVRRLHDFDMELRLLLMSSVNEVEISFREKFAYFMEREFGCFWQYREGMFKKPKGNRHSVREDIQYWIKRYRLGRKCPFRDILDKIGWGKCYRIFSRLSPEVYRVKECIACEMGIPSVSIFSSVIYSFVALRNDCAHMRRVWNERYTINPQVFYFSSSHLWLRDPESVKLDKTYYRLCLLNYFHQVIDPDSTFRDELLDLLKRYEDLVPLREMGFPEDWIDEPMWQRGEK